MHSVHLYQKKKNWSQWSFHVGVTIDLFSLKAGHIFFANMPLGCFVIDIKIDLCFKLNRTQTSKGWKGWWKSKAYRDLFIYLFYATDSREWNFMGNFLCEKHFTHTLMYKSVLFMVQMKACVQNNNMNKKLSLHIRFPAEPSTMRMCQMNGFMAELIGSDVVICHACYLELHILAITRSFQYTCME